MVDSLYLKNIDFDMYLLLLTLLSDYNDIMPEDKMEINPLDLSLELNCSVKVAYSSLKRLNNVTDIEYTPVTDSCVYICKKNIYIGKGEWIKGNLSFKMPRDNYKIYANRCEVVSHVYLILLNEIRPLKKEHFIDLIYGHLARECKCKVETIKVALKKLELLGLITIQNKRIQIIGSNI